jgi:hypothetical protein
MYIFCVTSTGCTVCTDMYRSASLSHKFLYATDGGSRTCGRRSRASYCGCGRVMQALSCSTICSYRTLHQEATCWPTEATA